MKIFSASEARSQWRELLDKAVAGENVYIERGGVQFILLATPPAMEYIEDTGYVKTEDLKNIIIPEGVTVQSTPKNNSLAKAKTSEEVKLANEAIEKKVQKDEKPQYCRNGHYLGATGKCLQKSCKYA